VSTPFVPSQESISGCVFPAAFIARSWSWKSSIVAFFVLLAAPLDYLHRIDDTFSDGALNDDEVLEDAVSGDRVCSISRFDRC